jgi:tungstate transport system permease protein
VPELSGAIVVAFDLVMSGDSKLMGIVFLSLRISLSATFIAFGLGSLLGAGLSVYEFSGRSAVLIVLNALLGLPPVVVGLLVYVLVSRSGPLGSLGILFTPSAMIMAQFILVVPIVTALVHRLCSSAWAEFGGALMIDGASRPRAALTILAMVRTGLVTTFLAAFGRAIAEVGAIVIVGGNILGYTRTMTTAIALETSRGDLSLALGLGLILVSLTLIVSIITFALNRAALDG